MQRFLKRAANEIEEELLPEFCRDLKNRNRWSLIDSCSRCFKPKKQHSQALDGVTPLGPVVVDKNLGSSPGTNADITTDLLATGKYHSIQCYIL
jgi:hypothetical protein